jgi:S-adenosylmethionine-diacylglycerol 3-amino-3-carboxypropyl transferase
MAAVLRQRLEKLACDFDIRQNYFAWQAFGRGYAPAPSASLPPYLQAANYEKLSNNITKARILHSNFVDHLRAHDAGRFDRYVLLDAQDWMTDAQLTDLWSEITRTSRPGARVIFRTAAEPSLLPGRLPDNLLGQWHYEAERSADYTRRDRSAIYGGFHLYIRRGA